jgi:TonB family protein
MADSTLLNLTAFGIQIASLTLLAEVCLRVLPVAAAGFRYAYWRLVLAAALIMPWVFRTSPDALPAAARTLPVEPADAFVQAASVATAVSQTGTSWLPVVPWVLAGGAALRLVWVGAGIVRLRSLRRQGAPIVDAGYAEIQQRLGTSAELREVRDLPQPVTFGVRRPVVLLPASLARAAGSIRLAAVTHELVHVQRRDWLFVLFEEVLRAALWFQPAIWWITARVRLTREEFTDHLAVLATGSRRSYVEALLAFADAPRVGPAPAFIRRGHLFHRIVLLSQESAMSSARIVVSGMMLAALLGAGGWYAGEAFPVVAGRSSETRLAALPQQQGDTAAAEAIRPVTPENPIPRRLFATSIPYPLPLAGTGYEAALSIRVVLDAGGFVQSAHAGARAVASPGRQSAFPESEAMELFGAAAVEAISRWQYAPPTQAPLAFYLAVVFKPGTVAVATQSARSQGVHAGPDGARMATPAELADMAAQALARRAAQVGDGARSGGPFAPSGASAGAATPGTAPAAAAQGAGSRSGGAAVSARPGVRPGGGPIRVGGSVMAPTRIRTVQPAYPAEAKAAGVQGVVIVEAIINEQGRVDNVRVLRSVPPLDQAAIDAVRQWEYTPTLLNGLPVAVVMTTTVQFTLESPTTPNSQAPTPN